jgi:nicotinamide-nucleotide amidase
MSDLLTLAGGVAAALQAQDEFLVLAESCTGGLVAASMTGIPGISGRFCGSAVVYRETTKMAWLGVSPELLEEFTAESVETTECLARSVLEKTPEATVSAAVTGHLGPNAPIHDGLVFFSVCRRHASGAAAESVISHSVTLRTEGRIERQRESASEMLSFLLNALNSPLQ